MLKNFLIIVNVLISVISFFTFIIGNITVAFGNKYNSGFHILLGYTIIVVPIIASLVFNIVMVLNHKDAKIVNNNVVNFISILVINVIPYIAAYLICWQG